MSTLERISLSIDQSLLEKLSSIVEEHHYENRSEFIRDLIRDRITAEEWKSGSEVVATLTLIYNHHQRNLSEQLIKLQHDFTDQILAATHVHISHHICAEMIMLKGRPDGIRTLADAIRKLRGVLHAALTASTTGDQIH